MAGPNRPDVRLHGADSPVEGLWNEVLCADRIGISLEATGLLEPGVDALDLAAIGLNVAIHLDPRLVVPEIPEEPIVPIGFDPRPKGGQRQVPGIVRLGVRRSRRDPEQEHHQNEGKGLDGLQG